MLFIVVAHVGVETTSFASRIDYEEHSLYRNSLYRPNVRSHDENARGDVAAPAKRIVEVAACWHTDVPTATHSPELVRPVWRTN